MRALQIQCDECSKVLAGMMGTAHIKEPYLTIKGRITLHEYDEAKRDHVYTHATRDTYEENMFCNVECLSTFVEHRVKEHKDAITHREPYTPRGGMMEGFPAQLRS